MHTTLQFENLKGKRHLGDVTVDGKIILNWVLKQTGREGAEWTKMDRNRVQ
jgi:hypothetical protein